MKKLELEEMKLSVYERINRAIDQGDKEKAKALLEEANRGRIALNDLYTAWVDLLYTYISEKVGEEAVHETTRMFCERLAMPALKGAFGDVPIEERIKKRCSSWTTFHGAHIDKIEEDDEKFILTFKCPSGGEVRCRKQFGKTKKAYPWSWGMEGLAYYCVHHPILDMMMIEEFGFPGWALHVQPEGRCVQYIYKNPEAVPEEYYKRVGMKKKTRKK